MSNELSIGKSSQYITLNEKLHSTVPPNITVILPAYNEEVSIGSVVLRTKKYSRRVVVVDAASSDHTVDVAEMAGAEVIRSHVNRGREISLKNVVETASDSDIIVIMNIGVCHDPGLIPRMIAPIREGTFDFSVGICFSKLKKGSENVLLLNNKSTESKPIGYLAFSKECLSKIDFSQISLFSMRSLINLAEKTGIKALHIDIQEEHEASLFRAYKIGVVVPAYNEERLIQETIDGIPAYVDKIYVINDASTDRTAEIINSTTDPRVIPIHHEVNKGVGAAIINGYKRALADEMDLVAVMAGDNQMDPDQLPKLIMPIIEGKADYAKGNRLLSKEMREGMSRWRSFGNGLLSMITKIGSGYWNIADPQNGYTVISRYALETIDLDSIYTYYGYCNDLLLKMNAYGMRVVDVTMPARYGSEKSKIRYGKYIRKVAPMIFRGFLWRLRMKYMVLDFHPLVLFYFASMVLFPLGLLFNLWIFLQKLIFHGPVSQNYPLLAVFISLVGMQLLLFAMFFDMQVNKTSDLKTA
ncbi:MAG: glycosyltransferase [Methanosarcina barkeri]|nr:glycosyltransferase [Methanosarcina sp. ERenArc_MAG2]